MITCSVLVAFAAAFLVLFEPSEPLEAWPWNASKVQRANLLGRRHECEDWFSSYVPSLQYLTEASLTGGAFFSCGVTTDTPTLAWGLTVFFYFITGLLLLNMLIAMMAKTFDQIYELSAVNFQLLLSQMTMAIDESRTASPPFNLLGLPFELLDAIRCAGLPPPIETTAMEEPTNDTHTSGGTREGAAPAPALYAGAGRYSRRDLAETLHAQSGEKAARVMFQLPWVMEYMLANLDGVVQEQRWRQSLTKSTGSKHRLLMQSIGEQTRVMSQLKAEVSETSKLSASRVPPFDEASAALQDVHASVQSRRSHRPSPTGMERMGRRQVTSGGARARMKAQSPNTHAPNLRRSGMMEQARLIPSHGSPGVSGGHERAPTVHL